MGQNREDWSGLDAMTSDFDSSLADGRTAREAHEEEVAAVQRVESLVPPARFGALMVECRSAQGQEIADMAARSNGLFTQNYLEKAERGELTLDGGLIGQLAGLYEVDAGPVVPLRSELILDLDRQELKVGDTAMSFNSIHVEDVLQGYVSLVYKLRGQQPGSGLVLRDRDLDVLSASLSYNEPELRRKLDAMTSDFDIRLADGRTAREAHEEEVAADQRVEWGLLVKEVIALCIVIALLVARQMWFV